MEALRNTNEVRNRESAREKGSFKALISLMSFVVVYLMAGLILNFQGVEMAFYQFPAPIAAFMGIIIGVLVLAGSFEEKMRVFLEGCGSEDIIIMCMIYLLADLPIWFQNTAD